MATTCTEYRIESLSVHTGRWFFFMQLKDLQTAKKVRKSVEEANPTLKLRIKQIRIVEGKVSEILMKEGV